MGKNELFNLSSPYDEHVISTRKASRFVVVVVVVLVVVVVVQCCCCGCLRKTI